MRTTRFLDRTTALRDFFASVDAQDLEAASARLVRHFDYPRDSGADWTEVEYDFNRLFVGPGAVPAPPYASAYQPEPALMGRPTLEVRAAYRRLGLEVPNRGSIPDDHIAFELDAVAAVEGAEDACEDAAAVLHWLVAEHMGEWVPQFTAAVRKQPDVSPPISMAAQVLTMWLEEARSRVRQSISTKE